MALLHDLRDRLGADSDLLAEPEYERTPKGRIALYAGGPFDAGGLMYFRDHREGSDGIPCATRVQGGRAEFAYVEPDGRMVWSMHPLGDTSSN